MWVSEPVSVMAAAGTLVFLAASLRAGRLNSRWLVLQRPVVAPTWNRPVNPLEIRLLASGSGRRLVVANSLEFSGRGAVY